MDWYFIWIQIPLKGLKGEIIEKYLVNGIGWLGYSTYFCKRMESFLITVLLSRMFRTDRTDRAEQLKADRAEQIESDEEQKEE